MADVKFSDLSDSLPVNAAEFCFAISGTSFKCTRAEILIGAAGQAIDLTHVAGGHFEITSTGDIDVEAAVGQDLLLHHHGGTEGFKIDASGNVTVTAPAFASVSLIVGAGSVIVDYTGVVHISSGTSQTDITYYPANTSDWSYLTTPFTLLAAIDAIARDLVVLKGSPITYP